MLPSLLFAPLLVPLLPESSAAVTPRGTAPNATMWPEQAAAPGTAGSFLSIPGRNAGGSAGRRSSTYDALACAATATAVPPLDSSSDLWTADDIQFEADAGILFALEGGDGVPMKPVSTYSV